MQRDRQTMKRPAEDRHGESRLLTPIFMKTKDALLPADLPAYLLLSRNGLWLCRNHEFFASSVRARHWPAELASHGESLALRHPLIASDLLESVVGFFDVVARKGGCEAAVLLVWNRRSSQVELVVPEQLASVSVAWNGKRFPVDLNYEIPDDLGSERSVIGDVHSHVYESAYSSGMDKADEEYRAGLHIVIGRLDLEPPDFHAEYVVDGTRFEVRLQQVAQDYRARAQRVPVDWLERVTVRVIKSDWSSSPGQSNPGDHSDKSSRGPTDRHERD